MRVSSTWLSSPATPSRRSRRTSPKHPRSWPNCTPPAVIDVADRLQRIGRDVRVTFAYQDEALGLGHAVGCAREAVGDEPFAVLLPDEIMGDSSLLAQMCDLSAVHRRQRRRPQAGADGRGRLRTASSTRPVALDDNGVISIRNDGREAGDGRCPQRPDHHRSLRADTRRVRQDRSRAARRRRRDPAHRCAADASRRRVRFTACCATSAASTPAIHSAG